MTSGPDHSETTLPIVERPETSTSSQRLCLVLAFDHMRPTANPGWFIPAGSQLEVGRGVAVELDGRRLSVCDRQISTRHFTLSREDRHWVLVDAGSKNGTFVNGARTDRHVLRDGDVIEAGASYFVVTHATEATQQMRTLAPLHSSGLDSLVPALATEFTRVDRLSRSDLPIHLHGETGTGKEVVAHEIHRRSGRCGKFIGINCGALPDALIASELFGAKRGAYSGAATDREGLVKASHRGTLFLDEIAELSLASQAALLRVLQEREVTPIGGTAPERCDLRVVSATNKDLDACCTAGTFRRDLYARLCGANVELPPLRARRGDLGLLIGRLLSRVDRGHGVTFTRGAARALFGYEWPCNVRELERALELALATAPPGVEISEHHLSLAAVQASAHRAKDDPSRFRELVVEHKGNVTALSRALGTSRSHVRRLAQRYACDLDAFRASSQACS
jgi:transcriptional regulator with PAS, ATPase and Fis domain